MKDYYYIIQGRTEYDSWGQLFKGKVQAESKKEARSKVEEMFSRDSIPMRIKREDISKDSILLSVYEMAENHFTRDFFENRECKECSKEYTLIDKFNHFGRFGNYDFCSPECDDVWKNKNFTGTTEFNSTIPVIYKITQISTGKVYIGKTIRSFTLRWWEHIKSPGLEDKFHKELCSTDIEDWTFQVVETMLKDTQESEILTREKHWIKHYNSVNTGFNSVGDKRIDESQLLMNEQ